MRFDTDRLAALLAERGTTPLEVRNRILAGNRFGITKMGKTYIHDLLKGGNMPGALYFMAIADVLDVDPEYLAGVQNAKRRADPVPRVIGAIIPGIWYPEGEQPQFRGSALYAVDARYAEVSQVAFAVMGDADEYGLGFGQTVIAACYKDAVAKGIEPRPGDVVVAELRSNGRVMTTLGRVENQNKIPRVVVDGVDTDDDTKISVLGIVLHSIRFPRKSTH